MSDDADARKIMVDSRLFAAQTAISNEIIRMLIMSGLLQQDFVVSSFERLSADLMKIGAKEGVMLADLVRDFAAGVDRKPS